MDLYSAVIFAILLWPNSFVFGSNAGVVGLGRTIFEPLCCYGCLASFWGLDLTCTVQQNLRQPTGSDASCHSTNIPYLNSLAYCIQTKCASDNVSLGETENCWNLVAGDGAPVNSLQDNLPATPPAMQLAYDGISLQQASLANDQFYEDSRSTIKGYVKQEAAHALYGTIVVLVVIGFCLYLGLLRAIKYYLPNLSLPRILSTILSRYFTMPALMRKTHLRRVRGNLGYVPSRALSVLILVYVALNAAVCAINYPTLNPDTWYISSKKQRISYAADRLGVLSFANIALAIMFSGRNAPLLWITGRSRTDILTFHRWIARVAVLQAVAHVVLYWMNTSRFGYNMFTTSSGIHTVNFNQSYWTYGIIAIIGLGFMVFVFSMLPVRVAWYEAFLTIHIILAIATLLGLWQHVGLRFSKKYGYEVWLYIAFAFWGFDRAVRPLRIILLNWKAWFIRNHPSAVVELLPGDKFVKVTVFPSTTWHFSAGQHCFLYFPMSSINPFQSHPFSIASWNDGLKATTCSPHAPHDLASSASLRMPPTIGDVSKALPEPSPDGGARPSIELQALEANHHSQNVESSAPAKPSITFIIRPQQGLTRTLHQRLLKDSKKTTFRSLPVFMEGPYGSAPTSSLRNAEAIVAIAGGIGITSILGYLNLYLTSLCTLPFNDEALSKTKRKGSRFALFWSVREDSLVSAIKSQLPDAAELRGKGVDITIVCTSETDEERSAGRLDISEVIGGELVSEQNKGRNVCVVSCGPGAMADEVRSAVVEHIGMNGVDIKLIEEAFCW